MVKLISIDPVTTPSANSSAFIRFTPSLPETISPISLLALKYGSDSFRVRVGQTGGEPFEERSLYSITSMNKTRYIRLYTPTDDIV